jgi:hypothetical protein
LHEVQGEVATVSNHLRSKSHCPEDSSPEEQDEKEEELTDKLDKLKSEFTQLLHEVRRRKSLIGDPGSAPVFEVYFNEISLMILCNYYSQTKDI